MNRNLKLIDTNLRILKMPTTNRWFRYILEHPEIEWNHSAISKNENITFQDVIENPQFNWDWCALVMNQNIPWKTIIENLDKPWNINALSRRPDLDIKFVLANPQMPWNFEAISSNPNVTWDIVKANKMWNHPDKTKRKVPWNICGLSRNPNITMDIVENNPKIQWSLSNLRCNPNLTEEFIEKNLDKPWDLRFLLCSKVITWDFVKRHASRFRLYPSTLSLNPNITWDIIENDIKGDRIISWSSESISQHPQLTIDIIKKNKSFPWNKHTLTRNPAFTSKIIKENPRIFSHVLDYPRPDKDIDLDEFTWEDWLALSREEKGDNYFMMYDCPNINWSILESCKMRAVTINGIALQWSYYRFCSNPMSEPVRKRIQERCRKLKEELIAEAMSPKRISWLIEKH